MALPYYYNILFSIKKTYNNITTGKERKLTKRTFMYYHHAFNCPLT